MSFTPINPEENQQAGTGQTTNNPAGQMPPQVTGSVGAGQAGGSTKGATSGSPTQFGSSASKLGDYLSANAPQITDQANTLAGTLNSQYGNLQSGITNAANQFGQQVQGGYAGNNPDVVNQAMQDPTKFASDPNNVKAFQGQYNNAYTGPTSFEGTGGYSDIQNQVGQAVQQGGLLGTQAGLQSYLQGQGTNPTKASSTLDTLLMQGNPEAQATINKAAGQFSGLTGQLGAATTNADQSILDAQNAAQASKAYAQGKFNPYEQGFANDLTTNASNAESGRQAYNTASNQFGTQAIDLQTQVNNYLAGLPGKPSITDFAGQAMAGNKPIVNAITAQNFSTPEQYAQAQAIQQLMGNTAQLPIDQSTAGLAGTAPQIGKIPSISDLAGQYSSPLYNTFNTLASNPNTYLQNPGWKGEAQSEALAKYLQQYNPTAYTNPQGGEAFFQP